MRQFTNALKSVAGGRTLDRVVLIVSILFIVMVAFQIRSTIAAVSADVTIAEVEVASR